jgi:hypothetical protein
MPGVENVHVDEVDGFSEEMGKIRVVDGGTNEEDYFVDHTTEHGELTLSRIRDGSPADAKFWAFYDKCRATGERFSFTIIQRWAGKEVMKIKCERMTFFGRMIGKLDTKAKGEAHRQELKCQGKYTVEYL